MGPNCRFPKPRPFLDYSLGYFDQKNPGPRYPNSSLSRAVKGSSILNSRSLGGSGEVFRQRVFRPSFVRNRRYGCGQIPHIWALGSLGSPWIPGTSSEKAPAWSETAMWRP